MSDDRFAPAVLHALALVASIRTALGVSRAIDARRAGRDPSAQEAEAPVRAYLAAAVGDLGGRLVQLRLHAVAGAPDDPEAALVQAFEGRLALSDLAEALRVVHQKLLSLYPAVPGAIVEAVRLRHHDALRLAGADGPGRGARLEAFLDALADDLDALREALAPGR